MSVLDQLKEYRVVRVVLPLNDGGTLQLDGVAKTTEAPLFEITFLPDQLHPEQINQQDVCQVTFDVAGTTQTLRANFEAVLSDAKLQLRLLESVIHTQKRAYFRVDAELSVNYWVLDAAAPEAAPVTTPLNISGGGLRLPVDERLVEGTRVGLEIVLDVPQARVVECVGEVIRTFTGGQSGLQAALSFVDIEQEDQDAIVAFCLAEQRKQLRLKVQVLGS